MAIAFVQQATGTQAAGTTATATLGASPTSGNTLVACIASGSGDVSGVSGGGVTTWTKLKGPGNISSAWVNIYFGVVDTTPATGVTATATSGTIAINASEWSGIKTSGAADASSDQDQGPGTTPTTGPITASAGPCLYLAVGTSGQARTAGPTDSFSALTEANASGRRVTPAYRIDSGSPASATPSYTIGSSVSWDMIVGALLGATDTNASGGNAAGTGAANTAGPLVQAGALIATAVATVSTGQGSDLELEAPAASATGAAYTASETVAPNAGHVAATGAAYQPPVSAQIGNAAATGSGYTAKATLAPSIGQAAATGEAYQSGKTVATAAGLASPVASVAALDATIDTATYASAEAIAATAAAADAVPTVAASAAHVAVSGVAYGPGIQSDSATTVASGYAAAQAEAVAAFASIGVATGYGSGSGAAHDASVTISAPVEAAAATAVALVARAGSFTGPSAGRGPRGSANRPRPHVVVR